ncbi:MAG: hypothetical protein LUG12_09245 [Erysipelotrichaceae bacterium]|nr:hypothetical protein [Erysipelotrichaceae bacterium]
MQEKEKVQGFKYDFTFSQMKTMLFHSKKCPKCSGKLIKEKTSEIVEGKDVNSKSDPFFVSNLKVVHYGYIFRCQKCGCVLTLDELAKMHS